MATEMKSSNQGTTESRPETELDPQALAAIRDLLDTQPPIKAQPVAERQAEQRAAAQAPEPTPDPTAAPKARKSAKTARTPRPAKAGKWSLASALKGYRPSPRHIVLASLALLILFRPWLVVGLVLLGLLTTIGVFLILGYDGFWARAMRAAQWYAHRRPERAEALHRKLDSFAIKWDNFLDIFPEGSVDGLYLPDFGELAQADARHDAALERRLAGLSETKV